VKRIRTADCVVGGFRYATGARVIGSLCSDFTAKDGLLHHVGFIIWISKHRNGAPLTEKFERLAKTTRFHRHAPGDSLGARSAPAKWQPVAPKIVVEVAYDHFTGGGSTRHEISALASDKDLRKWRWTSGASRRKAMLSCKPPTILARCQELLNCSFRSRDWEVSLFCCR